MTQKSLQHMLNIAMLSAFLLGALAVSPSYAGLYKWTDENGEVHFGDTPPPASTKHGHEVLGNSGVKLRTVERELTKQERIEASRVTDEMKRERQEARERARIDRLLELSFPTVQTLDAARDDRLSTYDDSIAYLESRRDSLVEKEDENSSRISHFRRKKLAVPDQLTEEAATINHALTQLDAQISDIQKDRYDTILEFKKYNDRLRELRRQNEYQ